MKKLFLIILMSPFSMVFAQNAALTTEVSSRNGTIYFNGNLYSGELYKYNENAKTACNCTMKAIYKNGKLNGKYQSWYVTGQQKQLNNYVTGKKNGNQISWRPNGIKESEEKYLHDKLIEKKEYYLSGNLKSYLKYNPENTNIIYNKSLFDNGIVKKETNYKSNIKEGEFLENFLTGKTYKKITYKNGNEIKKLIYDEDGSLVESLLPTSNQNHFEINKFENGKTKLKGFYTKAFKKDSIWATFDNQGNKLEDIRYNSDKIISEGKYLNNQKNGIWKFYLKDGVSQKNITYKSGAIIETKIFKMNHLLSNHFKATDEVALFEYVNKKGTKENIVLSSDQSFTKEAKFKYILGTIARSFLEKMRMMKQSEFNENTLVSKIININNIYVTYTSSSIKNKYAAGYITAYDAYIHFNLIMRDAENNKIFSKSYKMNKSGKLLNSILNNAVQTYSRTKKASFFSALKSIKFKKFFKKYFPINKKIN
ncbi:hypothetical protein [Lutibacter sp.]|uniref:toxin-antitoxin system YwqK family antitoxin n=1 Tax=Lutibacter sp. TaxID=1925666 RepID=UPI0025BE6200|nr:hypothetical protein [Lutibacter sp.]MCF6182701.1 hypothetical protein [Lutibacter sp.]